MASAFTLGDELGDELGGSGASSPISATSPTPSIAPIVFTRYTGQDPCGSGAGVFFARKKKMHAPTTIATAAPTSAPAGL